MRKMGLCFSGLLIALSVTAVLPVAADSAAPKTERDVIDWGLAQDRMSMLSQMGYHPFLMPLIMQNRDAIGLTNKQIQVLRTWRNKNRVPLIHAMNQIIQARTDFQRIALNPDTREEVLYAKQDQIFKLHQKVLKFQLSCRRSILDTFDEEQWDNFRFVLIENGYELD